MVGIYLAANAASVKYPLLATSTSVNNCYLFSNFGFACFASLNTGFVQCYFLGSRKFCCTLVFNFALFSNFCFARFASQTSGLCSAFLSPLLKTVTLFCFACFALPTSGLCSAFPFGYPKVYTLLVFFVIFNLLLLCVLCPTSSGWYSDFFPALLEFARAIFCFVLFSFKFVFCVLSLTNLIFLRFP